MGSRRTFRRSLALLAWLLLYACPTGAAGLVLRQPPAKPDPAREYLFFLHGRIVEEASPPRSPRYGVYEYEAILETFADQGFVVVSERRPRGTAPAAYARKLAGQVRALLAAGVPVERVSVVGFSKGGGIVVRAAALLGEERMSFAVLAGCGGELDRLHLDLRGRVLSMYDEADEFSPSCAKTFAASRGPLVHEEVVLHLGTGHGAFFRPTDDWVPRVVRWVRERR